MNELCTLTALRAYRGLGATETGDDALLTTLITRATRAIETYCHRKFYPRYEVRHYDLPEDSQMLWIDDAEDLLAVTTLTNGDDTTIGPTYYVLRPPNVYPKYGIRLLPSMGQSFISRDNDAEEAIYVAATWGYHNDWTNAWTDSADTVENSPLTASGTSLTVNNGANFEAMQLLKIESEYLSVSAISSNTVTVKRGVNGTTAASHIQNVAIYIFAPLDDMVQACVRLAAYLYAQKDSPVWNTTALPELGQIVTPAGIPVDVKNLIEPYRRLR